MWGWMGRLAVLLALLALAACGGQREEKRVDAYPAASPQVMRLVTDYAHVHGIPESLMHRIVQRESGYNPDARNGPYYGLMQIHPQTARTMGYRGEPGGLLDAETNLRFAGKYLRGAWLVARGNHDRAVMWYSKGYYYEAKRMGLLEETGLR